MQILRIFSSKLQKEKHIYEKELTFVKMFYASDININLLEVQLLTLHSNFEGQLLTDIVSFVKSNKELFSELVILIKLILVMPATNATSERSFSAMRRLKSYLRSSMSQRRLNNLMVLHIYKEKTDQLDLIDVGNNFVANHQHRLTVFGKFSQKDLQD